MGIKYLDKDGLEYYHNKTKEEFAPSSHTHVIDTEISDTSTNPLENRAIHKAIADAVDGIIAGTPRIEFNTKAAWNAQTTLVGENNTIYIYTDYLQDENGKNLAGIKVGDGQAFLIDAPFIDKFYYDHINNTDVHITNEERNKWNQKVRCYRSLTEEETLVFTTN